jgi:hypothetical protein
MRTAIAILIGIVLVFCFRAIAPALSQRRAAPPADGTIWFIALWLVATVVDFLVGVSTGHGVVLELGVHALIFAVPAALAWYLRSRRSAPQQSAKDIRPSSDE